MAFPQLAHKHVLPRATDLNFCIDAKILRFLYGRIVFDHFTKKSFLLDDVGANAASTHPVLEFCDADFAMAHLSNDFRVDGGGVQPEVVGKWPTPKDGRASRVLPGKTLLEPIHNHQFRTREVVRREESRVMECR